MTSLLGAVHGAYFINCSTCSAENRCISFGAEVDVSAVWLAGSILSTWIYPTVNGAAGCWQRPWNDPPPAYRTRTRSSTSPGPNS
jgi:hypothetical protein